jgi:hypothetical protein
MFNYNYFQSRYFLIQTNYKDFLKNYEIIDLYTLKSLIKTNQKLNNLFNPLFLNIYNFILNYPLNVKIFFLTTDNNTPLFNIHFKYINQIIINKVFIIEDKLEGSFKEIEKEIFKIRLPSFFNLFKGFLLNSKIEIYKNNEEKFILKQEKLVNYLLYKDKEENLICSYYKTTDINKIIEMFYSIEKLKEKYFKEDLIKNILLNKTYILLSLSNDVNSLVKKYSDDMMYLIFSIPTVIDILI